MIVCPKCGKELSEDTKYCDNCGTPIFETVFCPNCGKEVSSEFAYCQNCGASVIEMPVEGKSASGSDTKKKFYKNKWMFGGIVIAVFAVLVIIFFRAGKSMSNYAFYIKDKEIFITDFDKDNEAWQLTSRLADDKLPDDELILCSWLFGYQTYISEDGKYIFFPDKFSYEGEGCNIYYRVIGKPEAEPIKIDSDIISYKVNNSSDVVTYLKGEERNLYQYKIKEGSKDKIASDVEQYEVADDGTKIVYINSEGSIYLENVNKDKDKLASEASSIEFLDEEFKTVYYIKNGSLYKQIVGEDRIKIASDVDEIIKIYGSGEIYYLKNKSEEVSLMDYVTDDMKVVDASISSPERPSYPSWWQYNTTAQYNAAIEEYEKAYDAYEAAFESYIEKLERDELREDLKNKTLEYSDYSLCFFDGKEETVITDSFDRNSCYAAASEKAVITYKAYNQSDFDKVKLSEIESVYDVNNMIDSVLATSADFYVAAKNTVSEIEKEKEVLNFGINASGSAIYYIDDVPESKNHGSLYRIIIENGEVGEPEVYDNDVYINSIDFVSDKQLKYFKDYKDNVGELYINKEMIDFDVYQPSIVVRTDLNKVFYFNDWNEEKEYGTLKVYQEGETIKIADDLHDFFVNGSGHVLFLSDYSLKYNYGELYEWYNGETEKVDEDVSCIIHVSYGR